MRLRAVIEANPALQSRPDLLTPGEPVLIPAKPATAPATPAEATDRALKNVQAADHTLAEMNRATQGTGAALPALRQQAGDAQLRLKSAVQAEVDSRIAAGHGNPADPQQVQEQGQAMLTRHAGDPAAQAALKSTLADIHTDREVAAVMKSGAGQGDPAKALHAINDGFAKASPQARARLLADGELQSWVAKAATSADASLAQVGDRNTLSLQAPAYQAAQRLDDTTRGLDSQLAAAVTAKALPGWEAAQKRAQAQGIPMLGMQGTQAIVSVAGRVAEAPGGAALVSRLVGLGGMQSDALRNAVGAGAGPAYLFEMAHQFARQPATGDTLFQLASDGVQQNQARVGQDVQDYGKHFEELSWLVHNHGGTMTPQQLDKAIADYTKEKGPAWQQQTQALRDKLAEDGTGLLTQMRQLQSLPPELAGKQGQADALVDKVMNDPKSQLAISVALQQRPQLSSGAEGQATLNFFAQAKLGDSARKMGQEFATAYVKSNVLGKLNDIDRSNPASLQQARDTVAQLKDGRLAKLLGVKPADMDKAISSLEKAMPQAGDTVEQTADRLKKLDEDLDKLGSATGMKAFDKSTLPGQLLRGIGFAAAGAGFINSLNKANEDPSLKNVLKTFVDFAGLGQKASELALGTGLASEGSLVGNFGGGAKIAGRVGAGELLGGVGALFDVWNAADAFSQHDPTAGVLYGTGAAGGLLAAFGSGSMAGPIGIGLVAVSVAGLAYYNHVKNANAHENDVSAHFLGHSGLDAPTAKALVDQSGDGYSPVPALYAYGASKGLNQAQTATWLDRLQAGGQLGTLRDEVHHMLDTADGDVGKLQGGSAADKDYYQQLKPRYGARGMRLPEPQPRNLAQLDSWMRQHGIATP